MDKRSYLSVSTLVLLRELGEECQEVLELLAQLEVAGLSEAQKETILGELSAAEKSQPPPPPTAASNLPREPGR